MPTFKTPRTFKDPDLQASFDAIANFLSELGGRFYWGNGSPENVIAAPVGAVYLRRDGAANTTLYIKESGTNNTGWTAK